MLHDTKDEAIAEARMGGFQHDRSTEAPEGSRQKAGEAGRGNGNARPAGDSGRSARSWHRLGGAEWVRGKIKTAQRNLTGKLNRAAKGVGKIVDHTWTLGVDDRPFTRPRPMQLQGLDERERRRHCGIARPDGPLS